MEMRHWLRLAGASLQGVCWLPRSCAKGLLRSRANIGKVSGKQKSGPKARGDRPPGRHFGAVHTAYLHQTQMRKVGEPSYGRGSAASSTSWPTVRTTLPGCAHPSQLIDGQNGISTRPDKSVDGRSGADLPCLASGKQNRRFSRVSLVASNCLLGSAGGGRVGLLRRAFIASTCQRHMK